MNIYWRAFILKINIIFVSGAAAASRLYVEAITKLARQAQQGTWGGSSDVGEYYFDFQVYFKTTFHVEQTKQGGLVMINLVVCNKNYFS